MAYDPKSKLINLKGKQYLETRYRIEWFREDHPDWTIETRVLQFAPVPVIQAIVSDEEGRVIASDIASAVEKQGVVWAGRSFEKAATAAQGRALGLAGYGSQFALSEEDDAEQAHLADSPIETRKRMPAPELDEALADKGEIIEAKATSRSENGSSPNRQPTNEPIDAAAFWKWVQQVTTYKTISALEKDMGRKVGSFATKTDVTKAVLETAKTRGMAK